VTDIYAQFTGLVTMNKDYNGINHMVRWLRLITRVVNSPIKTSTPQNLTLEIKL